VNPVALLVGLVAAQRIAEMLYAGRNARALKRRGGGEHGRAHYPLLVAVHIAWLAALLFLVPGDAPLAWAWLAVFVVLQALRLWVIASLGPYWTTRIITLAGAPLVQRGPYRFLRHPNYVVVAGEIAVLPLVFGAWRIALVFSLLNLAALAWRIRVEERALAPRRLLPPRRQPSPPTSRRRRGGSCRESATTRRAPPSSRPS
jgi:methyltransferase